MIMNTVNTANTISTTSNSVVLKNYLLILNNVCECKNKIFLGMVWAGESKNAIVINTNYILKIKEFKKHCDCVDTHYVITLITGENFYVNKYNVIKCGFLTCRFVINDDFNIVSKFIEQYKLPLQLE